MVLIILIGVFSWYWKNVLNVFVLTEILLWWITIVIIAKKNDHLILKLFLILNVQWNAFIFKISI